MPSLVHAEDPARILRLTGDPTVYRSCNETRPADGEAAAVATVADLARATGARVHVLHVSSAEAMQAVAEGPDSLVARPALTPDLLQRTSRRVPRRSRAPHRSGPPSIRDALWEGLVEA